MRPCLVGLCGCWTWLSRVLLCLDMASMPDPRILAYSMCCAFFCCSQEDLDLTEIVSGHLDYPAALEEVLRELAVEKDRIQRERRGVTVAAQARRADAQATRANEATTAGGRALARVQEQEVAAGARPRGRRYVWRFMRVPRH